MCDVCADFLQLLVTFPSCSSADETIVNVNDSKNNFPTKNDIETTFNYVHTWPQRQCMCCYRDIKNFEKFNAVVQSLICLVVIKLKSIETFLKKEEKTEQLANNNNKNNNKDYVENIVTNEVKDVEDLEINDEEWSLVEVEKLLLLVSKAFLLNFPLYIAYKHGVHSRLDEITAEDAQNLGAICDLHDNDIPAYLLKNVILFVNNGGFNAMNSCFEQAIPVSTAHSITAAISNIKLWLNYRSIIHLFVPLRVKVLQYMCKLSDQDLRAPATRSMADFMWSAIRDPLDSTINFDVDGLALAFKYFNSTTLTMRLAGMAQINAHINLFNEICTTETVGEVEIVGQKLADWLTENQIISHLFGPNLHVEVIKQSHVVLNFLAVENQVTEDHINLIWQAAQLKHCSKTIYDILPSLVKNLAPRPATHLYSLLCHLDPKEHTEQSIYIASALTKLIWSRDGARLQTDSPTQNLAQTNASSSENSVSIDGSNSDEEQQDEDSSTSQKSPIDVEECSDSGVSPCKQIRIDHQCCDTTSDKNKTKTPIIDEMDCVEVQEKKSKQLNTCRITNIDQPSSSSDDDVSESGNVRKKIRKRRKQKAMPLKTRFVHELVEAIWAVESPSEGDVINDSDGSETQIQASVLSHLHNDGPYITAISDNHLTELLSGGENDGSYSSPMSNKSEKNMADFDEDESPCEEELEQLASRAHCLHQFALHSTRQLNKRENIQSEQKSDVNKIKQQEVVINREGSQPTFKIAEVCQPGNTLLWDLLQDDKIGQLGETLALEVEKQLGTLLCFTSDKTLRTKFIEGCLHNLASNKSVIVSLRLLSKLLASFQQFRTADSHQITLWAEKQHKMLSHFFNNLKFYQNSVKNKTQLKNQNDTLIYSHVTEVQVRLQFLTAVFSTLGSPKSFGFPHLKLSLEQVDALWDWLAYDPECADCLFGWLQNQAKGIEQHALGIESLQHIYTKKIPELKPEGISTVALALFQQLCSLARMVAAQSEKKSDSAVVGMSYLWKIALRAYNTEVSLGAIQYINSYYMGNQLKLEKEFVSHCMNHLIQAAEDLNNLEIQDNALMRVQRALMLLNSHLEMFRRRYAYHLRRWTLEGKGIGSHSNLRNENSSTPLRIILQPAGLSEKSILQLYASDFIADLKAEIAKWWEIMQGGAKISGLKAPVLGLLLSEGPLRIITQGQELTSEYDERTLGDVGFKDNQIVYVSLGGRGARRKEPQDHPSLQPPPPKECLPTVLLLQSKNFEELFCLMQTLGDMKMIGKTGKLQPHTKAQLLSRRVWDILAMLPTNPNLLESFKKLSFDETNINSEKNKIKPKILELLDPNNLQKFMYSLHIVESLSSKEKQTTFCGNQMNTTKLNQLKGLKLGLGTSKSIIFHNKKNIHKKICGDITLDDSDNEDKSKTIDIFRDNDNENHIDDNEKSLNCADKNDDDNNLTWKKLFIEAGGIRHLINILISGTLQSSNNPNDNMNEWRHDCLASLLRIIGVIGFEELKPDDALLVIPKIQEFMLELMNVEITLSRLSSILNDEAHNYSMAQLQFRTGFWGRAQIVQFVMNILVSFAHSSKDVRQSLWKNPEYFNWLQKFILEDPEPGVRREVCAGLYRICLGNAKTYHESVTPLIKKLISFLPIAEKMTYQTANYHIIGDDGKEPYGPACRDYFWLLSRLVDTQKPEMVKNNLDNSNSESIDIEKLCRNLSKSIIERDYFESRHGIQDDGLVGLLNLMVNLIKYDPPFKFSDEAKLFMENIFDFLFDLPTPQIRNRPKCKSHSSRSNAYDLLVELCKNCPRNYSLLHNKLLEQHKPGPHSPYPWDYWPRDDGRSECGYVGLTNLGATCYMASCIQHLYMMPQARNAILNLPTQAAQKHTATLYELQRMFAYLMESERKSYNPRSFCRVYQMDHQPLNTGEQKDMAEFFIDLVSKLEEMSTELKILVKKLFCGTLSNNVVSLDCGHVSRNAEEFYTVRCQVADMRNLHESLDEVTVKDTLEGDNMYTCSQCGRKVRAEKRACFKKLPQILCFNTMRYTFNMVTMLKEKVNTHFSFPMRLDMSDYVEKTLMPQQYLEEKQKREKKINHKINDNDNEHKQNEDVLSQEEIKEIFRDENESTDEDKADECNEYDLVGVTVHTGTADGGHYYSFIKERHDLNYQHDRWFLFNDAEVKPFDPSQIAAECFGGEMTSKTYDSVTEKYLDFSFEKTNSAYMLFYERHNNKLKGNINTFNGESSTVSPKATTSLIFGETSQQYRNVEKKLIISNTSENETDIGNSNNVVISHKLGNVNSNENCDIDNNEINSNIISYKYQSSPISSENSSRSLLNKELEDWIWQDNRNFLQDKNIFEHNYFSFMWQICGHIPQTILIQSDITSFAAQLSVSFFIETFIHAKEKPTMVLWVELLTKQFNSSQDACEWFLKQMSAEPWWPVQVLIQCPNQMVRQMFQRLVIHVIQRLRQSHYALYLKTDSDDESDEIGNSSCVTRFIKSLINLMEHGAKAHLRHLSEYFGLLLEFSRMGDEETLFLLRINVIRSVVDFYLGNKNQDSIDANSDDDNSSDETSLSVDKARPASLDKMIALVANLVERSRGTDFRLHLSPKDYNAIAGGKGFPFLYQQIKDNINPHQTRHLIHALCRWDERLATQIITMLFASVTKHTELCASFFKLLTLLTEPQGGPSGLPCFSQLVLQRVWDAAEYCPQSALDWLACQAPRNKIAHAWILQSAESWVEQYLIAHNNSRVRNAASYLLVSLVPSQSFRANYRTHSLHKPPLNMPNRELNGDAQIILHTILNLLLSLLRPARGYTDIAIHGTAKLTAYFTLLTYCMVSKTEKLMLGNYMRTLWELFHPRLSEPSVPAHHNKHALLAFWHHATNDCPENAQLIASCPDITRNIAFNYILADHDDSEIVAYNRAMLPAYYGLLRFCCQQSRALTRQLAAHQNLQWAFKNITPHPTQYSSAVEELFRLMTLFATRHSDASEQEEREVSTFRRTTLSAYLTGLDARVSWSTLIAALKILVDNEEDRLFVIFNGGIEMCFDALHTLHSMYHEATACHVSGDLQELLGELVLLCTTWRLSSRVEQRKRQQSPTSSSHNIAIKGLPDAVKRLATLLNTYNSSEMRKATLDVLKELVRNPNLDVTSILAPIFTHCHLTAQNTPNSMGPLGPYFPRRGTKTPWPSISKTSPRPPRPMVQMSIPNNQIIQKGNDDDFDKHLDAFYKPYHDFLDIMMRVAVISNQLNDALVKLSCLAAIEAAPLHFNLFPKFWVGIYNNKSTNKYSELLLNNQYLIEYIDIILRDERLSLNDNIIRNFLEIYYPKITSRLATTRLLYSISYTLHSKDNFEEICGDIHAIYIIAKSTGVPVSVRAQLRTALKAILAKSKQEISEKDNIPPKKKYKASSPVTPEWTYRPTSPNFDSSSKNITPPIETTDEKGERPFDESNDADDENEDEEIGENKIDTSKKSTDFNSTEEKQKEKFYIETIEGYIRAILELVKDDLGNDEQRENKTNLLKSNSPSEGTLSTSSTGKSE